MAKYSGNAYTFSFSIVESFDNAGSADNAGNGHPNASVLYRPQRFPEPGGYAIESLCLSQEHHASCDSQADGKGRGSARRLKADR
jgi:hypothetical protein